MPSRVLRNRAIDGLSLTFLILPNILFAWGWLKPLYATPLTIAALYLVYSFFKWRKNLPNENSVEGDSSWWKSDLFCICLAIAWAAISGIGGVGLQNSDYVKHNAIFLDLMHQSWPVHYSGTVVTDGAPRFLVYALAHYLPAALVGKFAGWTTANLFLFVWDILGTALALVWVIRIARLRQWTLVALFPFFSGLDFLGHYLTKGGLPRMGDHIEWWQGFVQFSSHTTMLVWVPQHAIAGWLAAALVVESVRSKNGVMAIVPLSLIAIWSPLVTMGLFPFVATGCLFGSTRGKVSIPLLGAAAIVLALTVPFFAANDMSFPHGFFAGFDSKASNIVTFVLFYAIELLVFVIPVMRLLKGTNGPEQLVFATAIGCLLLFPLYKLGAAHDLAMRGSVSALFLLACFVLRALQSVEKSRLSYQVLAIAFAIGSLTAISEIARSINFYKSSPPTEDTVKGIAQLGRDEFVEQYLGKADTIFFKYLAKEWQ